MISLEVDGRVVEARKGATVLEAALAGGVYIPHLCSHPELAPAGACGLCVVTVDGVGDPVYSCHTEVRPGMAVHTKSEEVLALRRLVMELVLSRHPPECTTCTQYLNCELQSLKQFVGITEELRVRKHPQPLPPDQGNPLFVRDMTKCVLCGRCVRACGELRGVHALAFHDIGRATRTGPTAGGSMAESGCRFCGACVEVCPTGALRDKDELTRARNRRTALLPCRYVCPAEIDVPTYVRLAAQGDYGAATAVVREKAPFPLTLGHVCDHPCEAVCRRGAVNEPIAIREIKRFVAERDDGTWKERSRRELDTGKRVAVIGSGPAGLTAAFYLRKLGHAVTVFESLPVAGGMLRVGIPEDRLPRSVLEAEIAEIEAAGVEIRVSSPVSSLDALFEDGHDVALIAVGTHQGGRLPIPGGDQGIVSSAVDFLRGVHLDGDVAVGESVLVLGGGNVAFDCARVARRLGAARVEVACLEARAELPASPEEVAEAEALGVVVRDSRTFREISADEAGVCTVGCLGVESFEFDEDGRLEVEEVWGSEHALRADTVILALGQRPVVPEAWGVDLTPVGTVALDDYTFESSREAVFAAGDALSGTASVVEAIASGRRAASVIDRYLGGSGEIEERLADVAGPSPVLGPGDGFAGLGRISPLGAEAEACGESERCLQCDLRLKMARVRFWGDY